MTIGDVPIYYSERRFEVVTWGVGHRGLLLRSLREPSELPLIEIWFKPAYAVCLSSLLEGVHLTTPRDAESLAGVEQQLGRRLNAWEHLYRVVTQVGPPGWVVAGSAAGRQHHQAHDVGEPADSWGPQEGLEELFRVNVR